MNIISLPKRPQELVNHLGKSLGLPRCECTERRVRGDPLQNHLEGFFFFFKLNTPLFASSIYAGPTCMSGTTAPPGSCGRNHLSEIQGCKPRH